MVTQNRGCPAETGGALNSQNLYSGSGCPLGMAHDGSHIGTTCSECGTHHRVIESIPNQPLTRSLLDDLRETDAFTFAQGVGWMFGEIVGSGTDEEVTEDIIIATDSKVMHLSLYEPGWVVELEAEPRDDVDETVEDVAQELWMQTSQGLSEAMHDVMG